MKPLTTRQQKWSQQAYDCVSSRRGEKEEDYRRFAKRFPSLIHGCGLAQAVAFAAATGQEVLLRDIEAVLGEQDLAERSRQAALVEYLRLSRDALQAAAWIKRYAEALLKEN
jgi:CRISPR-associated protein Cmr5